MGIIERSVGASKLDYPTVRDISQSQSATVQAAIVVVVAAVSTAIGRLRDQPIDEAAVVGGIAIANWLIYSVLIYLIGSRIMPGPETKQASLPGLIRTVGFAQSPSLIAFIGVVPGLGWIVSAIASVWTFVAMIFAIKLTLRIGSGRAIAIVLAAVLVTLAVTELIVAPFDVQLIPRS